MVSLPSSSNSSDDYRDASGRHGVDYPPRSIVEIEELNEQLATTNEELGMMNEELAMVKISHAPLLYDLKARNQEMEMLKRRHIYDADCLYFSHSCCNCVSCSMDVVLK